MIDDAPVATITLMFLFCFGAMAYILWEERRSVSSVSEVYAAEKVISPELATMRVAKEPPVPRSENPYALRSTPPDIKVDQLGNWSYIQSTPVGPWVFERPNTPALMDYQVQLDGSIKKLPGWTLSGIDWPEYPEDRDG